MARTWGAGAALAILAGAACGGSTPDGGPRLDVSVSPTPAAVGTAQVRVEIVRPGLDGQAVENGGGTTNEWADAVVVVTARPEVAGGAAVTDTATAWRPEVWVVDALPFDRAGEWTLDVRAELPDGRTLSGTHPIRVVGG